MLSLLFWYSHSGEAVSFATFCRRLEGGVPADDCLTDKILIYHPGEDNSGYNSSANYWDAIIFVHKFLKSSIIIFLSSVGTVGFAMKSPQQPGEHRSLVHFKLEEMWKDLCFIILFDPLHIHLLMCSEFSTSVFSQVNALWLGQYTPSSPGMHVSRLRY